MSRWCWPNPGDIVRIKALRNPDDEKPWIQVCSQLGTPLVYVGRAVINGRGTAWCEVMLPEGDTRRIWPDKLTTRMRRK